MAEKCYQHKLKVDIAGKRIWLWDGRNLADEPEYCPKRKAEYFFGLRYAREALELDPNYKPAQIVLLNFFLERTFDQRSRQVLLQADAAGHAAAVAGSGSGVSHVRSGTGHQRQQRAGHAAAHRNSGRARRTAGRPAVAGQSSRAA